MATKRTAWVLVGPVTSDYLTSLDLGHEFGEFALGSPLAAGHGARYPAHLAVFPSGKGTDALPARAACLDDPTHDSPFPDPNVTQELPKGTLNYRLELQTSRSKAQAPVAQGIERRFPKPCVARSSRAGGTTKVPFQGLFRRCGAGGDNQGPHRRGHRATACHQAVRRAGQGPVPRLQHRDRRFFVAWLRGVPLRSGRGGGRPVQHHSRRHWHKRHGARG